MIHVYEDNPDTLLSKLFLSAYPEEEQDKIQYSEGATKLISVAWKILQENPSARVALYVDISPDNINTLHTYNRLATYAQGYVGRLFVFPVLSAEYYFLKSVSGLLEDSDDLRRCLMVLPWLDSSLVATEDDHRFVTSFEKYCKLFLLKAVPDCMKHTRRVGGFANGLYGYYFERTCACDGCWAGCTDSPKTKGEGFVRQHPLFPVLDKSGERTRITDREALTINRFLCASHDAFVGRFIGDCEVDKLIPLYSLSADEYARAYKKYKLKKFPGSISPVNLIERI